MVDRWIVLGVATLISVPGAVTAQTTADTTGGDSATVRQILAVQDRYPAWSPGGDRIVFDSDRTGTKQIFIGDVAAGAPVQLTHSDAMDRTPVFSPDGEWIAFQSLRDGVPAIFVMRPDGSGLRKVTHPPDPPPTGDPPADDSHPRWAPDGESIVFNRNVEQGNAEVFEIRVDGTGLRRLTDWPDHDTYPSISPDGRHLLWRRITLEGGESESGRNSEIFIADRDGSNARNLTNHPAFDGYPVWLPSGEGIVFASNRDGEARLDFNIYVMRPDGSDVTRLTELMPGVRQARPSVSPDGRRLVFNRDSPHDGTEGTAELIIKDFGRPIAELLGGADRSASTTPRAHPRHGQP
ncbi:MAG: hypothetical protein ACODAE_04400 [Gemmatimonadota bacterium]